MLVGLFFKRRIAAQVAAVLDLRKSGATSVRVGDIMVGWDGAPLPPPQGMPVERDEGYTPMDNVVPMRQAVGGRPKGISEGAALEKLGALRQEQEQALAKSGVPEFRSVEDVLAAEEAAEKG